MTRSTLIRRAAGVALLGCAATLAGAQTAAPALPTEALRQLAGIFALLRESHVDAPSGEELVVAAIRGMLQNVDPDGGEYFTRDELAQWRTETAGGQSSIGALLQFRQRAVVISSLVAGGPAERAGLQRGESIAAIDGKPTADLRSFQVHRLLDGPVGSPVSIDVADRAGVTRRIEVTRAAPQRIEQAFERSAAGTAVLRPPTFQDRTLTQLAEQLSREWSRHPFDGLVLDLRGNPGGLLDVSIGIAALFLPPDAPVLKTVGRLPEANQEFRARPRDYSRVGDPFATLPPALRAMPLVVLVDENTASGAEIVAAALKDNRRARVVGRQTFGRGSIQTVRTLADGAAVKFTTAVWESPAGVRLNGRGVMPDVTIAPGSSAKDELDAALSALRKQAGATAR